MTRAKYAATPAVSSSSWAKIKKRSAWKRSSGKGYGGAFDCSHNAAVEANRIRRVSVTRAPMCIGSLSLLGLFETSRWANRLPRHNCNDKSATRYLAFRIHGAEAQFSKYRWGGPISCNPATATEKALFAGIPSRPSTVSCTVKAPGRVYV